MLLKTLTLAVSLCVLCILPIYEFDAQVHQINERSYCAGSSINNTPGYFQVAGHGRAFAMDLNPAGNILAVSNDTGISLYEPESFEELATLQNEGLPKYGGLAIAWSPDGKTLAAYISPEDGIRIWDINRQQIISTLEIDEAFRYNNEGLGVDTILWSPDGSYLASAGGLPQKVWAMPDGEVVFEPQTRVKHEHGMGYEDTLHSLIAWSTDTRYMAMPDEGTIKIWETETWAELHSIDTGMTELYSLDWSTQEKLAVTGDATIIQIWNMEDDKPVLFTKYDTFLESYIAKWSPDSTLLASGGRPLELFDLGKGEVVKRLAGDSIVYDIDWLSGGEQIIVRERDHHIHVWNVTGSCILRSLMNASES